MSYPTKVLRIVSACLLGAVTAAVVGLRPSHFGVVGRRPGSARPAAPVRLPAPSGVVVQAGRRGISAAPTSISFAAACERAAGESDPAQRLEAVRAAVRAWADSDPAAALAWADARSDDLRSVALAAAAQALARLPRRAVAIGRDWMRQHPGSASEVGSILVGELVRQDEFLAATQLAGAGPAESCDDWFCTIADRWAQRDPSAALDLAQALRDQGAQGAVFTALARGWSQSAPEQLANYALTLSTGEDRTFALHLGLDEWLTRDPSAAGAWINRLADPQERDQAIAAYVGRTDQVERSTATALTLAESIGDPTLRLAALRHVVQEWAAGNRWGDVAGYVAALSGLDSQQRRQLVAAAAPPPESAAASNPGRL